MTTGTARDKEIKEISDVATGKIKISVIGVGCAGCESLIGLRSGSLDGVRTIAVDSDVVKLDQLCGRVESRIQIGPKTTEGRGSGGDPDIARTAIGEHGSMFEIQNEVEGADMVFVIAGMGGGIGTGASPIIARAAKEMGILTIGVVTRPFPFEGTRKAQRALEGIEEMQGACDAVIIVDNHRVMKLAGNETKAGDIFSKVGFHLAKSVEVIIKVIREKGLINVDFADFNATIKDSKQIRVKFGWGKGENRAVDAIEEILKDDITDSICDKASGMIASVFAPSSFTIGEATYIFEAIEDKFQNEDTLFIPGLFDNGEGESEVVTEENDIMVALIVAYN